MASMANPFASLHDVGASGVANPFLQPLDASGALGSDTSSDGSWTDEPPFLFTKLSTRSGAVPIGSIIKRSMTEKRIKDPSSQVVMQCMQGPDGKYYYIPIDPYNESHLKTIIDELSPLLVNPTPSKFQKGALYTYVIASIITKDPDTGMDKTWVPRKLYACKALNMFELGTKHHQIFFRMALTNELENVAQQLHLGMNQVEYALHAAGEIKCIRPTRLKFNYFSGTYKMKLKIPRSRILEENKSVKLLMHSIDKNYEMQFDPKPFIIPETMTITRAQLHGLNSKDIPTFGFDTGSQCYDMRIHVLRAKNMEKRTMGLEEMQQKYQQIMNPPPPHPDAYTMRTSELINYAEKHGVPIPNAPYNTPDEKYALKAAIQAHMDKKAGGKKKKRTMKKRTMKKRTMKKQVT
jgi:hypothetical protein